MPLSSRPARLIIATASALLLAYALLWTQVSATGIGRSDFASFYVGGTLLRTGHAADLYDESLQAPLRARLIAPDREPNLPFVDTPVAAALVLPVTVLGLDAAYRVWGLLELAVLVTACCIAIRAAPWPASVPRSWRVAAGAMALAGAGTWVAWTQAQWAPLVALGLAVAYRCWRSERRATGAAVLVAAAGIAKPQLALGLLAFMLGWRDRRVLAGAVAGAAGVGLASLALAGPHGLTGFVSIVAGSTVRWDLKLMLSIVGFAGSYLGNGTAAHVVAAAGTLAACAAAFYLGTLMRRDRHHLELALAGAAVLSLLAAPHAYLHDLVMLAPALIWTCAALAGAAPARAPAWRTPLLAAIGLWILVNATAYVDFSDRGAFPPGQLTAPALTLAAAGAFVLLRRSGTSFRYRAADETALGTVAHELRRGRGGGAERMRLLRLDRFE